MSDEIKKRSGGHISELKEWTVDIENVPETGHLIGFSVCPAGWPTISRSGLGAYLPVGHLAPELNASQGALQAVSGVLQNAELLIFHNAKHDHVHLIKNEVLRTWQNFADTMLMFHMCHEYHFSKDLTAVSRFYDGKPKNRSKMLQSIIDTFGWAYVPIDETAKYCVNDSEITAEAFDSIIMDFGMEYPEALWDREQKFTQVMATIEGNKVRINPKLCESESFKGKLEMDVLRSELGLNPNSNKDLNTLLIDKLGLPVLKRSDKTKKPSFDKETMKKYEEEYLPYVKDGDGIARRVLRYRGWSKAVSSYYDAWLNLKDEHDEISCSFKIHGTKTGRLSCEKPNLQQIPREGEDDWNKNTKKCFLARPGMVLAEWDYAQLEFRLAAAVAKEESLIEIFKSGEDIFSEMAKELGWERSAVKTLTYATLYGGGDRRVSNAFNVPIQTARRLRGEFFAKYPKLREMSAFAGREAKRLGYIEYWTGRRRHFKPGDKLHKAFNAWVQGGAFEIVKDAMIRMHDFCNKNPDLKMVLQVHDSIWTEHPKTMNFDTEIRSILEGVPQDFGVPFVVDKKVLHEA